MASTENLGSGRAYGTRRGVPRNGTVVVPKRLDEGVIIILRREAKSWPSSYRSSVRMFTIIPRRKCSHQVA